MKYIHIITGVQGTGKTLYLAYKMNCTANDKDKIRKCKNTISNLNNMGYHFSIPEVPIFCDFDCELHRPFRKPIRPYWVNGYYIGLPVEFVKYDKKTKQNKTVFRTMLLPPGYIFLDEGNKYFDSKDDDIMTDFRKRWVELMRQFNQEMYLCAHRPMLVSKCVRDYADYTMFLSTDFLYDQFGNISLITMKYRYFENVQEMEAFLKNGTIPPGNEIQTLVIDCEEPCMNIPKYYDTNYFSKYFLKGAKNKDFDLIKHQKYFSTPEDIDLFCQKYNYKVPKELYTAK